jgi:hypothetical protein
MRQDAKWLWRRHFRLAPRINDSSFAGGKFSDIICEEGQIRSVGEPSRAGSVGEGMHQGNAVAFDAEATVKPLRERERYAQWAHSVVFAEVALEVPHDPLGPK